MTVTAYCAPGRETITALTLLLRGEKAGRILAHPWMAGRTDIILTTGPSLADLAAREYPASPPGDHP